MIINWFHIKKCSFSIKYWIFIGFFLDWCNRLRLILSQCKITSAYEEPRHLVTLKSVRLIWQSLFNIAFRKAVHLDIFYEQLGINLNTRTALWTNEFSMFISKPWTDVRAGVSYSWFHKLLVFIKFWTGHLKILRPMKYQCATMPPL